MTIHTQLTAWFAIYGSISIRKDPYHLHRLEFTKPFVLEQDCGKSWNYLRLFVCPQVLLTRHQGKLVTENIITIFFLFQFRKLFSCLQKYCASLFTIFFFSK